MNRGFFAGALLAILGQSTIVANGAHAQTPDKWALVIGIDEYLAVRDLHGAKNDARLIESLLTTQFGFPGDNVRVLQDSAATRQGILDGFAAHLLGNVGPGDVVVFYYAGHGSQRPHEGEEGDPEPDGWDETIVPHDSRRAGVRDITDDRLGLLLDSLTAITPNVTVIMDSCHSGTGTRLAGQLRWVAPEEGEPDEAETPGDVRERGAQYALLAAARSNQKARERAVPEAGVTFGAFTYALVRELKASGPGATYLEVMQKVAARVSAYYPDQQPSVQGAGQNSFVFSDSAAVDLPHYLVTDVRGDVIEISTGRIHGLDAGSTFTVYPPGERQFRREDVIARVELDQVGSFTSTGRVIEGGGVQTASRAIEESRVGPASVIPVLYDGTSATLEAVKARLRAVRNVAEHESEYGYILRVSESEGEVRLWGPDGSVRASRDANAPAVADSVAGDIRRWARWFNILAIENPASRVSLEVSITDMNGREVTSVPSGTPVQITVTNTSSIDLYVTKLALATDAVATVAQVYPAPNEGGLVQPGDSIVTFIPEAYVPEGLEAVTDYVRAIGLTSHRSLAPLTQGDVAGARLVPDDDDNPFARMLEHAATGRRAAPRRIGLNDWVVVGATLEVHRR